MVNKKTNNNFFKSAKRTFEKEINSLSRIPNDLNKQNYNKFCEEILSNKGNLFLMGIGKSGEIVDSKKLKVKIGNMMVAENGRISDSYDEEKLKEYMKWDSIEIEVNLKLGNDAFKCFTCDFTHDYIDINADYRN